MQIKRTVAKFKTVQLYKVSFLHRMRETLQSRRLNYKSERNVKMAQMNDITAKKDLKPSVPTAHWIWLSPEQYPELQLTEQRIFWPKKYKDCVAEFQKIISFSQIPRKIILYVSGDEEITLSGAEEYRSLYMKSISLLEISLIEAEGEVCIEPFLYFSHYPVEAEGQLHTSDAELDLLYDVCKWTLKICRQTLHLDSPKHQELLACSGDYYIESMMTAFTFGDMRL